MDGYLLAIDLVQENTPVQLLDDAGVLPDDFAHVRYHGRCLVDICRLQTCARVETMTLSTASHFRP